MRNAERTMMEVKVNEEGRERTTLKLKARTQDQLNSRSLMAFQASVLFWKRDENWVVGNEGK